LKFKKNYIQKSFYITIYDFDNMTLGNKIIGWTVATVVMGTVALGVVTCAAYVTDRKSDMGTCRPFNDWKVCDLDKDGDIDLIYRKIKAGSAGGKAVYETQAFAVPGYEQDINDAENIAELTPSMRRTFSEYFTRTDNLSEQLNLTAPYLTEDALKYKPESKVVQIEKTN
jgi:hypothetical protein